MSEESERRLHHAASVEADPEAGVTPGEVVEGRDGDEVGGAPDDAKGDGESWQEYAHRLEGRIKRQREELNHVRALRSPHNKSSREKIATLERLLGRKVAVIERLKKSVMEVVADRDAADRRLVTVVDTFANRRVTARDVVDAVAVAVEMSNAEVIYVHQPDHGPFAAIVVAGTEPYVDLHHREHEYEAGLMVHDHVEAGMF